MHDREVPAYCRETYVLKDETRYETDCPISDYRVGNYW